MIGWVQISRRDVARAEQAMLGDVKGVRDEIGVLAVHQAISDRLFPGTSVLHTRLRYALFVPWLMQRAARQTSRAPIAALRELEVALTGQLLGDKDSSAPQAKGIIGGRVYDSPAAQPPSFSYWTALSTWGLITKAYAGSSREKVLRQASLDWCARRRTARDEEGFAIGASAPVFASLPDEPDHFLDPRAPLSFDLLAGERIFMRNRLMSVKRTDQAPSLLARLAVEKHNLSADYPWLAEGVVAVADSDDRKVLGLARGVSALSGICRGVYLCLVEDACRRNAIADGSGHREHLRTMIAELGEEAGRADLLSIARLSLGFRENDALHTLLRATQEWLQKPNDTDALTDVYARAERKRKQARARLANTEPAVLRLREWAKYEGTAFAEPLHFRWPNVRGLLTDLHRQEAA